MVKSNDAAVKFLMLDDDPEDAFLVKTALLRSAVPVSFHYFQTSAAFAQYLPKMVLEIDHDQLIVLLLDLNMPCKSGLEWLKELRSNERLDDLFIVVFSTSDMAEEKARSFALGANEHLGKPDSVTELASKLNALYHRCVKQRGL